MAKTFFLRLLLAGHDDLICEVRESESDRLADRLANDSAHGRFFWFDAIDGRTIIVNLDHLQGARYLWNVASAPPDSRINPEENLIIALAGRREPISEPTSEDPKDVYTLFWELELNDSNAVTFLDFDGEAFSLIASQIVYLSAPKEVVDEGRRQANEEDGLEDPTS